MRQLWEACLDLHWIEREPGDRSHAYAGYTIIEYRKALAREEKLASRSQGSRPAHPSTLPEFDVATQRLQARYKKRGRDGKERLAESFSEEKIEQRANSLGDPWRRAGPALRADNSSRVELR